MFDNLPDLIKEYPIGSKIRFDKSAKRDDYVNGKFIVEGYLYVDPGQWYPAHKLLDNTWEIYKID